MTMQSASRAARKIVDDAEWNKVLEGVYTEFSIGAGYAKLWPDRTNPNPAVSVLVDHVPNHRQRSPFEGACSVLS
jgi:hypothetical protein